MSVDWSGSGGSNGSLNRGRREHSSQNFVDSMEGMDDVDWSESGGSSGSGNRSRIGLSPQTLADAMEGMDDADFDEEQLDVPIVAKLQKELERIVYAYSLHGMTVDPNMNPLQLLKILESIIKQRERRLAHTNLPVEIEQIQKRLLKIVQAHRLPEQSVSRDMHILTLLDILEDIIERHKRKFALLDISLEGTNLLEGSILQLKLDETRRKVSDVLESYQMRVRDAEQNYWMLEKQIIELTDLLKEYEKRNYDLRNALILLRRSGRIPDDIPSYDQFFRRLEEHLDTDFRLHSSFVEELSQEKRTKNELLKEICRIQHLRAEEQLEKEIELAELTKDLQLVDGLREQVLLKMTDLSSNRYEINQAINDWMADVRSCMEPKKEELEKTREECVKLEDELREAIEDGDQLANDLDEIVVSKENLQRTLALEQIAFIRLKKKAQELDHDSKELKLYTETLSPSVYFDARSRIGSITSPQSSKGFSTPRKHKFGSGVYRLSPLPLRLGMSPKKIEAFRQKFPSIGESDELESPEKFLKGSPYRGVTYFDDSNSMSIHTTPRSTALPYTVTPPSPFHVQNPLIQSIGENGTGRGGLGTITMPGPSSRFAPRTATVSSPALSHVTNRFDIGKSFNLHTVCQTSTPYHQVTRVESSIPKTGYSGEMINSPLSITHSAEITPTQYESPIVSKSRFGYTDPTAEVLNMPPDLVIPMPRQEQGTTPDVETYGIPPAVTPTSARRHNIFTPKGIFRRKHYNIRRLYEPEDYPSPELPWSPQYLPQDARSPVHNITTTSQDRYFPQAINRTFDASPQHIFSGTFDASPQYNLNTTYDASSPVNLNRTFEVTAPHSVNKTFETSPTHFQNTTFEVRHANNLDRTFDASPHARNKTFQSSPVAQSLNQTFDETLESLLHVPYRRPIQSNRTSALNRNFSALNRTLNRTFDTAPDALNRTFQPSPAAQSVNQTFEMKPLNPYSMFHISGHSSPTEHQL